VFLFFLENVLSRNFSLFSKWTKVFTFVIPTTRKAAKQVMTSRFKAVMVLFTDSFPPSWSMTEVRNIVATKIRNIN